MNYSTILPMIYFVANNHLTNELMCPILGHKAVYEKMLAQNGKKAGYSQVYDDPEVLIDAASNGKILMSRMCALPYKRKCQAHYLTNKMNIIISGNIERISELIKTVDIDIQNDVGDTALIRASEVGKLYLFKHIGQ